MCGIFGFCGKADALTSTRIRRLGIANQARGSHSSGLAMVANGRYSIQKKAEEAWKFFTRPEIEQKTRELVVGNPAIFIGHTRFATRGAISHENAHPYKYKNVIFAHNGSVSNFDVLQREYGTKFEVDSGILGYLLAEKNPQEMAKECVGSYAVPFIDTKHPETLQFVRHSSPLIIAMKADQLYFSSESEHLRWALAEDGFGFFEVLDDYYLSCTIRENGLELESKPVKPKTWQTAYSQANTIPVKREKWDWDKKRMTYSPTTSPQQIKEFEDFVDSEHSDDDITFGCNVYGHEDVHYRSWKDERYSPLPIYNTHGEIIEMFHPTLEGGRFTQLDLDDMEREDETRIENLLRKTDRKNDHGGHGKRKKRK